MDERTGGPTEYYWCLTDGKVVEAGGCRHADRLGPYSTVQEAQEALSKAAKRNEEWEGDERWKDD
ncbi:MAG: hypothetical protein ABWZ26_07440 [Candidatus Nanopelagicales bacterium]